MNGLNHAANEDELALHYERALIAGHTDHAANIRYAHPDLQTRFETISKRLAHT